jgi:hypothetical protein
MSLPCASSFTETVEHGDAIARTQLHLTLILERNSNIRSESCRNVPANSFAHQAVRTDGDFRPKIFFDPPRVATPPLTRDQPMWFER